MLIGLSLIVTLMLDTSQGDVCSYTYRTSPGILIHPPPLSSQTAPSSEAPPANVNCARTRSCALSRPVDYKRCQYFLEAPPQQFIVVNVTRLVGLVNADRDYADDRGDKRFYPRLRPCILGLELVQIYAYSGRELSLVRFCRSNITTDATVIPRVFHSDTNLLKLTTFAGEESSAQGAPASSAQGVPASSAYSGRASADIEIGFIVQYHFKDKCAAYCGDGSCLPSESLLCNGLVDCLDYSDESEQLCRVVDRRLQVTTTHATVVLADSHGAVYGGENHGHVIVMASVIALCAMLLVCLVLWYSCSSARVGASGRAHESCRRRHYHRGACRLRDSDRAPSLDHSASTANSTGLSSAVDAEDIEVVYVPGMAQSPRCQARDAYPYPGLPGLPHLNTNLPHTQQNHHKPHVQYQQQKSGAPLAVRTKRPGRHQMTAMPASLPTGLPNNRGTEASSVMDIIDLPPHIPVSRDGEEGYHNSQHHLHHLHQLHKMVCDYTGESVRPPPNRSVRPSFFDEESPPPYRTRSVNLYDSGQWPASASSASSSPVMMRCQSLMSNNSKNNNGNNSTTSNSTSHSELSKDSLTSHRPRSNTGLSMRSDSGRVGAPHRQQGASTVGATASDEDVSVTTEVTDGV